MVIIIMLCIDSNVLIFIFQSIIEKWFQQSSEKHSRGETANVINFTGQAVSWTLKKKALDSLILDSKQPKTSKHFADLVTFFQVNKCLPNGSERSAKQNILAKKLALFNIRLIAHEHLHMHLNKLRCIIDYALQTVI